MVCTQASAETPRKSMRGTGTYCSVNDNVIVNLDGGWNQGCGSVVAGALAAALTSTCRDWGNAAHRL